MQGLLAVASHRGTARGLVVFFTGGNGNEWWTGEDRKAIKLAEELRNAGFVVVQVKWNGTWHHSSPGDDAGTAHLACRPATVIRHVYEEYYRPLKIRVAEPGRAGFCITGNSAAASQVAYALSHYGLDGIVNLAIPTGGPSHSVLVKSMLEPSDERRRYGYPRTTRTYIDKSFGYFGKDGPGRHQDADFRGRWTEESVATGGSDYHHPTTRVHFIFGEHDRAMQTVGRDYFDRLQKEGSPMLDWQLVPDTGHSIEQTAAGRDALKAAILGIGRPGPTGRAGQAETIRSNRGGR